LWSVFREDDSKKKGLLLPSSSSTSSHQNTSIFSSIETDSCVLSLACHPDIPTTIACGTFGGEVVVANFSNRFDICTRSLGLLGIISRTEPKIYVSKASDKSHKEPVVQISWMKLGRFGKVSTLEITG
jgi:hypothetical protein